MTRYRAFAYCLSMISAQTRSAFVAREKPLHTFPGHALGTSASDLLRDLLQPDDAGELAHFLFLIVTQLEQQRHRGRLQLLDLVAIRIDRHAWRVRIGELVCRYLADNVAQRGLDRGPIIFLRR